MFFITYTIFQPPGTLLCRKIGPRVFLSAITFLWGCVMIGFGFVQDWTHLVGLRAILGVLEVSHTVNHLLMFNQLMFSRPVSSQVSYILCQHGTSDTRWGNATPVST